jgi:hypothetical protein
VMALLIYGILEQRVRENMKQEEKPLILAGRRKLYKPTAQVLLKELQEIKIIFIQQGWADDVEKGRKTTELTQIKGRLD